MSLLTTLEARRTRLVEAERRAKFERTTIESALTLLRVGENEGVVRARLLAKGLVLTDTKAAEGLASTA